MAINIVVIGGGNHHNTLGVIRAIGREGYGVDLITIRNIRKHYVSYSKYVTRHHALADISELIDYLEKRECADTKEIVISCSDAVTEHLGLYRNRLSERYILPGVSEEGRIVELMDKQTMIKMTSERGILAPEVWCIPTDIKKVTYPCITKANISSHGGKANIVICNSREELENFIKNKADEVFIQKFIKKKEEVQFIGCSLRAGEEVIIPGMSKILRSQPNTNTGFLEYGPVDSFYNDILERSRLYIKDCRYSGLFSIEFLRDEDDKVYFLEINFRNDGNAYCVTAAGVNLPLIWVKANLGIDYKGDINTPRSIVVMPEFQDLKLVIQRRISLWQWTKDWKRTNVFLEYAKDDKKPFFKYLADKFLW